MSQLGHRRVLTIAVWFAVSTVAALGLLAVQPMTGPSPEVLSLVMLAPAIGVAVCWLFLRSGLPMFPAAASARRFGIALALSVAVVVIYFVVISWIRGAAPVVPSTVAGVPVLIMISGQVLGALTEEIGFRGFLLTQLQSWLPRPVAAILVGLLFGLWHVQYFALPLVQHLAFLIGSIALTLTMAYVMVGGFWQRMIICTIIHTGANLALSFTGDALPSMIVFSLTVIVGCAIALPFSIAIDSTGRSR